MEPKHSPRVDTHSRIHTFSPGYRPDLAVKGGGRGGDLLLLDTKVASPYVNSLTAEERHSSTYVAFAGTAERHTTAVLAGGRSAASRATSRTCSPTARAT
eukprot:5516590-Prymnesium_polylepis.1